MDAADVARELQPPADPPSRPCASARSAAIHRWSGNHRHGNRVMRQPARVALHRCPRTLLPPESASRAARLQESSSLEADRLFPLSVGTRTRAKMPRAGPSGRHLDLISNVELSRRKGTLGRRRSALAFSSQKPVLQHRCRVGHPLYATGAKGFAAIELNPFVDGNRTSRPCVYPDVAGSPARAAADAG